MKHHYLALLPLLLLSGCSLQERVDKTMNKLQAQYQETKTWDELPLRTITWQQAMSMMDRNNLELLRIRNNIKDSERNELSIYTQMIPGLTYYGMFNSSLKQLTEEINEKNFSSDLNVTFSIPTLTQIPYRVYANKATTFANIKALDGKKRELTATLYKHVRSAEIRQKQDQLESEVPEELKFGKKVREKEMADSKWGEIARVLGDSSARWRILPESMPRVRWDVYEPRLGKLDSLIVCQFAMQLEQVRLTQYGTALNYLPTINTSLYSPSLFSYSGGTYKGTFMNSEDTRINLNISYTVDTGMDIWNSYERNRTRYQQTKKEIAIKLMDYRNKLQQIRNSYSEYQVWKGFMAKRLEHLKESPDATAEAFIEAQKEQRNIEKELLNQELQSVETEAALIIQYGLLTSKGVSE